MSYTLTAINTGLLDNEAEESEDEHNSRFSLAEEVLHSEVYPSRKHKQAALLLRKGYDNEKIASPVTTRNSELAYEIVHHPAYYWFNFLTCIGLLLLAVVERPSDRKQDAIDEKIEIGVYVFEMLALLLLSANLVLRFIWLELKLFVRSRGTIIALIIFLMLVEIVVILCRGERHMRYTRALRPFLLLDTFLMSGVRRVVRQIVLCLKYIFDVMLVLFFLVAVFAIIAYFIFARSDPTYFEDLNKSFISMLITLTTANHPDVFLEAFNRHPYAPLFFIVYMFVTFYYFSNVLLAVVFAKFKHAEKVKYKKLFLHRRGALKEAFHLLKSEEGVTFFDFLCSMQIYQKHLPAHEVMCIFKSLKQTPEDIEDGFLSWDEFSNLYNNIGLKWALINSSGYELSWYDEINRFTPGVKASIKTVHNFVRSWLFDSIMTFIVLLNLLSLVVSIAVLEKNCEDKFVTNKTSSAPFCAVRHPVTTAGSFIFSIIYIAEISLRLFFDGVFSYFRKRWNVFDFFLVVGAFGCLVTEVSLIRYYKDAPGNYNPNFGYFAVGRPLVLLRLLRLKRNYLYLLRIMTVLAERMISVFFLLVIVYYVYAIIGMEVFSGDASVSYNCCHSAWYGVGEYFTNNGSMRDNADLYWLNNFNNLWHSYVTLYELMVVNNWFIIMEGFAFITNDAARIYFILFWITTTLVVNTAIVYIVDAFESGLLALSDSNMDETFSNEDLKRVIRLKLSKDNVDSMEHAVNITTAPKNILDIFSIRLLIRKYRSLKVCRIKLCEGHFRGKRTMDNHDLRQILYSTDIGIWKEEFDERNMIRQSEVHTDSSSELPSAQSVSMFAWKKTKEVVYYILG